MIKPEQMSLYRAILIANAGKDKPLDVMYHGGRTYSWNADDDVSWQEYKKAREVIMKYKYIEIILLRLKIV